jgi:hypothetical protein
MDERVRPAIVEAMRQLQRATIHADETEAVIDCLQRAQDSIDQARSFASPPIKIPKKKKDDVVPPGVEAMVL